MPVGPEIMRDRRIEKARLFAEAVQECLRDPMPYRCELNCIENARLHADRLARLLYEAEHYACIAEGVPTPGEREAAKNRRKREREGR